MDFSFSIDPTSLERALQNALSPRSARPPNLVTRFILLTATTRRFSIHPRPLSMVMLLTRKTEIVSEPVSQSFTVAENTKKHVRAIYHPGLVSATLTWQHVRRTA